MVRLLLPASFLNGHYDLRKRWLACQRITFVPMVASIIGTIVHIPVCYIFAYTFDFGLNGLAFANFVKEAITLCTTIAYCYLKPEIREVMQPFDMEALRGWDQYLSVSLPATALICAEWWAFQVLIFMAGALGVYELASQTICLNMISLLFQVALGI